MEKLSISSNERGAATKLFGKSEIGKRLSYNSVGSTARIS